MVANFTRLDSNGPIRRSALAAIIVYSVCFVIGVFMATFALSRANSCRTGSCGCRLPYVVQNAGDSIGQRGLAVQPVTMEKPHRALCCLA